MRKALLWVGTALGLVFVILSFVNASYLAPYPAGAPKQVAHRALGPLPVASWDEECARAIIAEPFHKYIPNTKDSVLRAQKMGAWQVEVDAQLTSDGEVILLSDPSLNCTTDGMGPVTDATLQGVQTLDAGYGYTLAGREDFVFRGQGATIPTLDEVTRALPVRGRLMVHLGADDPDIANAVAAVFEKIGRDPQKKGDAFYGAPKAVARIHELYPEAWAFNPEAARQCTADYTLTGWIGYVPDSCRGETMLITLDQQTLLWGWPNRLIARIERYGGRILIEAPGTPDPGEVNGITLPEQLTEIPSSFNGYVWTDDAFNTLPALIRRFDDRTQEEIDASQAALERRRSAQ